VIAKTFAVVVRFMIISFACQFEVWLGFLDGRYLILACIVFQ
jgi:hypothetical protein